MSRMMSRAEEGVLRESRSGVAWGRVLELSCVCGSGAGVPGALQWGGESRESQGNVRVPVYRWSWGTCGIYGSLSILAFERCYLISAAAWVLSVIPPPGGSRPHCHPSIRFFPGAASTQWWPIKMPSMYLVETMGE